MTVKKLWLMILILISIISIGINALILAILTDKYFVDYLSQNYEKHVSQVIQYTKSSLLEKNIPYRQIAIELETHLNDPITGIKLYSNNGELLIDINANYHLKEGRMHRGMMRRSMGDGREEIEQYKIMDKNNLIGILHIIKHSSAKKSIIAGVFKSKLVMNSMFSMIIALLISIIIGIFISKKMSRALIETADLANDIQSGVNNTTPKSFILEINRIRESLNELNTRLKVKQKNRKELVDQLMHQTRTPLTILKSHLEGIEDGIIEMNAEEIGIWQNQITNITAIITNMSGMIDANKENDEINVEEFEINHLIKQIINGIKPQFDKKNIKLEILSNQKLLMKSDQYKLSQIIYNLLTNAYKYTNSGGNVQISYQVENHNIVLTVKDTGIGIDEEELPKIFRAYYRGADVNQINGDGIGLYVVNENLNLIQGTIHVQSQKRVGSSFIVEIPIELKKEL